MQIKKIKKKVESAHVVEKSFYEYHKTGKYRVYKAIDENGLVVDHKEEIIDKKLIPEKVKKTTIDVVLWCVIDDKEMHEFSSEKEAKAFIRGFNS